MSQKYSLFHRKPMMVSLLACGLTLLTATGAGAQPGWGDGQYGGGGRGPVPFSAMDSDADGSVTAAEHAAFRAERISARSQEGRPLRNAAQAPSFEDLDANGDGRLTESEMMQFRSQRMAGRPCIKGGRGGGRGAGGPRYRGW